MRAERFNFKILVLFCFLFLIFNGCSLIPKRIEFFQDKVKQVPDKTEYTQEKERQAAEFVDRKIDEVKDIAYSENSSTNIIIPLLDASIVSDALKLSLGPPIKVWDDNPELLAAQITKELAKLNNKIDNYRKDIQPNVGKKIENSGIISIGYFTYVGIILAFIFIIWTGLKIYGLFNPIVGVGVNVAKVPLGVLKTGFSQLLTAGETFKRTVDEKIEDPETRVLIKELFRLSHERKQNQDIQNFIKDLTK